MTYSSKVSRRAFLRLSAGIAGLGSVAGLAACSAPTAPVAAPQQAQPQAPQAEQPAAQPEAPKPTEAPAAETVRLRVLNWESGEGLELHKRAFAKFTEMNPGIEIENTSVPWNDYYTKLQTEAAGGAIADLVEIGEAYTARWAESGVIRNLNPYIEADSAFDKADFYPNVLENFTWNGDVYVLPKDFVTWGLYYNKTLFDEAGVPYPDDAWDWAPDGSGKYMEAAQQLVKKEGDRIVQYGTLAPGGWGYYVPRVRDNGGRYLNEEKTECMLDRPEAIAAIQWIADLINKYQVAPTAEVANGGVNFPSGRIAMMPNGSFVVPFLKDAKFDWAIAPLPKGPQGRNSAMFSAGFSIASAGKHPDAAWKMASFMTREGSEMLASLGFSIPARKSIATKPGLYLNDNTKPRNVQAFMDATEYMGLPEITPTFIQQEEALNAELSLVMAGEKTAEEGMKAAVPKVNALLAKP